MLLSRRELDKFIGKIKIAGYTIVPLNYHDKSGKVKVQIGLAKGKKQYDKRRVIKDRELNREKNRVLKKIYNPIAFLTISTCFSAFSDAFLQPVVIIW